ncbi:PC-esterase domain-containing protein 1A-like isoform X2 [Osmerus eperlanus]|uniref:PC-esterase domain-containing protein 1A-like isoform X2 n=1 Tax=Osmerus eperlanus TaxID=29151 RepID=UPI002E120C4B
MCHTGVIKKETMKSVSQEQASKLLHNKFVVVLGDSIQRAVYKDLVLLLQKDRYLSQSQLKTKGELVFEHDCLVEGGRTGLMTNGTEYREVRQYRSDHHLVRFYFLTRIFSRYVQSVLEDFRCGLSPDVVVVNSCVWDVSRYDSLWVRDYRENLERFFEQLRSVLPEECLVVWNLTMPLGKNITGGFLVPEIAHMGPTLRYDIVEANFYAGKLADAYGLDVLDLHFLFRFSLQHRMRDGVHWNALAHRRISTLLLRHAAQAWGVALPDPSEGPNQKPICDSHTMTFAPPPSLPELQYWGNGEHFYMDSLPSCPSSSSGYFSFEEEWGAPPAPALRPLAPHHPAPALRPLAALRPPAPEPRPLAAPKRRTPPAPQHPRGRARARPRARARAPHAYHTDHHHRLAPPQYWPENQYVMRNRHTRRDHAPYGYQRQAHYPYPPY